MSTKNVKVNNTEKNAKVTKETLRNNLGALMPVLANSHPELALEIDKTLGKKTATFEVLEGLLNRAIEAGKTTSEAPVENQAKPAPKKNIKKTTGGITKSKKTEEVEEPKPETVEEPKETPLMKIFPEELHFDLADKTQVKLVPAKELLSYDAIIEAIENGERIYLATYWSERLLKQYDYSGACGLTSHYNKFPNDLDLLEIIYSCDTIKRIWAVSVYTEGMFSFDADKFEPVTDTNPYTGEKCQLRVAQGMEFEVYRVVD